MNGVAMSRMLLQVFFNVNLPRYVTPKLRLGNAMSCATWLTFHLRHVRSSCLVNSRERRRMNSNPPRL